MNNLVWTSLSISVEVSRDHLIHSKMHNTCPSVLRVEKCPNPWALTITTGIHGGIFHQIDDIFVELNKVMLATFYVNLMQTRVI